MTQNIIIYRDMLLPYSETFIPNQVENLKSYQGFYVGTLWSSPILSSLPINKTINLSQVAYFSSLWRLAFKIIGLIHPIWVQKILNTNPILIHAHFGSDGLWAIPLAKKIKIPLIVTFHGSDITITEYSSKLITNSYRLYVKRRQQLFEKADLFIAVSNFIKHKLITAGCPEHKIVTHYIGIDTDKFTPQVEIKRQNVVLFVGRLITVKGCQYLIEAMAKIQQYNPEIELVIIGDGYLRESLEKLAASKLKKYRFLGYQSPSVVKQWMNQAKVFCVPSITTKSNATEAFGMVFLEAQAMGLPVVSFNSGGIPEAVKHNQTGFLATEKDSEQLADYISHLFSDRLLWSQFSEAGQKHTKDNFELKKQTQILEEIYDSVLVKQVHA
jgi:glycosyltransferase involved in cell wall biosynthesis